MGIYIYISIWSYVWTLSIFSLFFSHRENVGNVNMAQKIQLKEQQHLKTAQMALSWHYSGKGILPVMVTYDKLVIPNE